jgi:uncharacterized phage infection (PIP) family protein YhgE
MNKSTSMNGALILIAVALAGAGASYHMTLDSRFAAIEQKLDQNTIAMQQFEIAQETLTTKAETLANLNKEVDQLQTSLAPLGKATREQTDSLTDMHKQIATLQAAAQAQQDAQKKLADYAAQLEKIKHDMANQPAVVAPSAPLVVPPPVMPVTVSAPVSTPAPVVQVIQPHASSPNVILPVAPRAESAVDIRPDSATAVADDSSVRALPVALPVAPAFSAR